jgi:hypothetical protein
MQPNELRAVLTKTDEVAIRPVHVEVEVYNPRQSSRRGYKGPIYCPDGLVKARVIQDGYPWIEKRTISVCGDQEYEVNRKSGVLVELDPTDLPQLKGSVSTYPHTEVITRKGRKYIRLITSRKAIFSSWSEYELEMEKRKKESEHHETRDNRLRLTQARLMGFGDDTEAVDTKQNRIRFGRLDRGYEQLRYDQETDKLLPEEQWGEMGHIQITIDQAELIWATLSPRQRKLLTQ